MDINEHIDALRHQGTCSPTPPNGPAWTQPSRPAPPGRSRTCCGIPATSTGGRPGTSPIARTPCSTARRKRTSCAAARPTPTCSPGSAPGHAALVETLSTADPGLVCATFMDAPSPLAFWARRQAHETAIHRADAESASGLRPEYDARVRRRRHRRADHGLRAAAQIPAIGRQPGAMRVRATDTGHAWYVGTEGGRLRARREDSGPDPAASPIGLHRGQPAPPSGVCTCSCGTAATPLRPASRSPATPASSTCGNPASASAGADQMPPDWQTCHRTNLHLPEMSYPRANVKYMFDTLQAGAGPDVSDALPDDPGSAGAGRGGDL